MWWPLHQLGLLITIFPFGWYIVYPPVICYIAIGNGDLWVVFLLKIVIFHSYAELLEGIGITLGNASIHQQVYGVNSFFLLFPFSSEVTERKHVCVSGICIFLEHGTMTWRWDSRCWKPPPCWKPHPDVAPGAGQQLRFGTFPTEIRSDGGQTDGDCAGWKVFHGTCHSESITAVGFHQKFYDSVNSWMAYWNHVIKRVGYFFSNSQLGDQTKGPGRRGFTRSHGKSHTKSHGCGSNQQRHVRRLWLIYGLSMVYLCLGCMFESKQYGNSHRKRLGQKQQPSDIFWQKKKWILPDIAPPVLNWHPLLHWTWWKLCFDVS